MQNHGTEVIIYGAEEQCPSCLNSPSSKETYEWLKAAISRKFPNQPFIISYVDITNPPNETEKREFAKKVIMDEMFYPVVVIEGKVVGEGNPSLKTIFSELKLYGYIES